VIDFWAQIIDISEKNSEDRQREGGVDLTLCQREKKDGQGLSTGKNQAEQKKEERHGSCFKTEY